MSDLDRVTTADGRVLTGAETAAHAGIVKRLSWASMHWGAEDLHPDALPHIAITAVAAATPLIEAQVREQVTRLAPFESIALTVANAQVERGEEPSPNVAAVCVMALARIARGESS